MRISLRRANRAFKDAWHDPKWQERNAPLTPETPVSDLVEEVTRKITDERLAPVVDQDGVVWRRTLNRPPPWR